MKLKPYQKVIILDFRINDHISDCEATFIREVLSGSYKGYGKVKINTIEINIPLKRIMDYDEYRSLKKDSKYED